MVVGIGNDESVVVALRRAALAGAFRFFAPALAGALRVFVAMGIFISDAPRASVK